MKPPASRRLRHVAVQSGGTIAGNAIGALLPFVIAHAVVAKRETDAYFLAVGTTLFVVQLFAVVLEGLIVPFAVEQRLRGLPELRTFLSRTLLQGAALAALATLAMAVVMRVGVLPRTGFTPEQQHATASYLLLLAPLPVLMTVSAGLSGTLDSLERFGFSAWSQMLRAGGGLVAVLLAYPRFGLEAVPVGIVLGEAARVVVLAAVLLRSLRHVDDRRVDARPARGGSFWRTASLQIASMVIIGMNPVVDKLIGSRLDVGAVTLLELCEKLFYTPFTLLSSGIAVVFGASWARLVQHESDRAALRTDFWRTQRWVALISTAVCIVAIAAVWLLRRPLAHELGLPSGRTFAWTFSAYAVGLPAALFQNLGVRLIVAFRHTRVLPVFATVAVVLNVILDIVGSRLFGVAGIALAFAIHRAASAGMAAFVARRLLRDGPAGAPARVARRRPWRRTTGRVLRGGLPVVAALAAAAACGLALGVVGDRYLLVFYLAALPLLVAAPLSWMPGLAVAAFALVPADEFPYHSLFRTFSPALAVTVVWAARVAVERAARGRVPVQFRLPWTLALLAAWVVLGVVRSPEKSTSGGWALAFLVLVILPPVLLWVRPLDPRAMIRPWLVLAGVLGAYGAFEAFFLQHNPLYDWVYHAGDAPLMQKWAVYRATTTLGHPLMNGLFFAVGATFGLAEWQRRHRTVDLVLGLAAAVGLVATASRGALAALVAGALVMAIVPASARARRGGRGPKLLVTLLATGLLAVAALGTYVGARSSSEEGSGSASARGTLFSTGWTAGRQGGIFGYGPGRANKVATATDKQLGSFEDAWLELYVALGPPGIVIALVLLGQAAVRAGRARAPAVAGGLATFALSAASFNAFEGHRPSMVLLGLLLGFALTRPRPVPEPAPAAVPEPSGRRPPLPQTPPLGGRPRRA